MDRIDRSLAHTLALNARASFADLAQLVGLSSPSTAERVRRLEERGVVRSFHAAVDPHAFGRDLVAFVSVSLEHPRFRESFLTAIGGMRDVLECHHTAGDDDYVLKVVCAGTAGLETLVSEGLKSVDGVSRTRTTIVLSTPLDRPFVPPVE